MVIDSTIKQKVVELHIQRKGRNETCRILKAQKVRISEATITHLIQDWNKRQTGESGSPTASGATTTTPPGPPTTNNHSQDRSADVKETSQQQSKQEDNTSYINENIKDVTGNPSLNTAAVVPPAATPPQFGDGLEPVSESKTSGSPLKRFLGTTAVALEDKDIQISVRTLPEPTFASDGPESSEQINIAADAILDVAEQEASITEKENKIRQESQQVNRFADSAQTFTAKNPSRNPSNHSDCETETPTDYWTEDFESRQIEEKSAAEESPESNEEISWDSDQFVRSRFFKSVMDERQRRHQELLALQRERQQRHQEILLIQNEKQQLAQLRQSIDREKQDFENEKAELQSTIPLARQLLTMKIDIRHFLPYVDILTDYSQANNTDLTTTAFEIAEEFKMYKGSTELKIKTSKELEVLQNSIQESNRSIQQLQIKKQQMEQHV
jgi:hypothetical protein